MRRCPSGSIGTVGIYVARNPGVVPPQKAEQAAWQDGTFSIKAQSTGTGDALQPPAARSGHHRLSDAVFRRVR